MKRTVALLTSVALMIPGAAVASANSTTSNYGHPSLKHVTAKKAPASQTTSTSTGSLPFTGLDLGALGAGGVLLLGTGLGLRRVAATHRN